MINKYRRTVNKEEEHSNFWPTFTDLLATILMVVIMLLISSESMVGGVEQGIASNVNNSVKQTLKENGIPIEIDKESGEVTFGETALFDTDSDQLKPEAKEILKVFVPKYAETIYKDYGDYISKIIVEGHTDDVGTYIYNLDLSQRRAFSVVNFIVGEEIGDYKYKDKLTGDIIAVGRSKAEPIKNNDDSVNRDKSRRVEIKYEVNVN
ncbi:OmpA family protein [Paraclostridium bifermentans]|jgi:outer membrane protein OmpA-like peptidoglycan-associated protein|uniref:OmpA family membrane protein n=2 Tax=Paraclostridium bifermentans TaxID=1490 RepID=T4VPX9_PARBF|nr:OmpA family protein [Paraclostridium bifermentans]MDV8116221.1 OmpA family protein [Bacillus sp. BAU-SS-2023]RDC48895.1 OmpA family protein [Acinetobacter sp. RIT592]EQK41680.1 ompA family membrane protein [[Clostridium] bifermentans ATCC 19299] [Paraclostridium bifermentans ATCC 19299]EQK42816.1 ompA family membrane protein [[Clostridium] bifermentans ATCC 638] [Paraclostridium bifermentans ATCC 638 = DSM 14991]MBN8047186.1 OmpA family protein [Paraclostridium bifermentans]